MLARYQDDTLFYGHSWDDDDGVEYYVPRPPDYYLAPERAWPAGTSILDDARPETPGTVRSTQHCAVLPAQNPA